MKLPIFIKIKGKKREGQSKDQDKDQSSNELKTSDETNSSTYQIQSESSRPKSKSSIIEETSKQMMESKPDNETLKMDETSPKVDRPPKPTFFPEVFPENDANNNNMVETLGQEKYRQNGGQKGSRKFYITPTPTGTGRNAKVEFNLEILSIDRSPRESLVKLLDPLKSTSKYALVKNGSKSSTLEEILKPRIVAEPKEVTAYCGYDCNDCCWTGCRTYNYCRPAFPWNNCDACCCPTVPRKLLPYVRKTIPDPCGDIPLLPPEPDPPKAEQAPIAEDKKGSLLGKLGSSISSSMSKIGSSMSSLKQSVSKSFNKSESGGGAGGSQMGTAGPTTKVYMMGQTVYSRSAVIDRNDRFLKVSKTPREFEDSDENLVSKDSNYNDVLDLDQLNNNLLNGSDSKMMLKNKMKSRPENETQVNHSRISRSARSKYSKKGRESIDEKMRSFMEDDFDDDDDDNDVFMDRESVKNVNHPYDNDYFLRVKTPITTSNQDNVVLTPPRRFIDENGNGSNKSQNSDDRNKNKVIKSDRDKYKTIKTISNSSTKMTESPSDASFRKDDDENFFDSFRRSEVPHKRSSKVPWCTKMKKRALSHYQEDQEFLNEYMASISKLNQQQLLCSMPSVRKIRNLDEMDDPNDQRFPSHRIYQRDKQVFPKQQQNQRKFRPPPAPKNSSIRTRSRDYYNRIITSPTNAVDANGNAKNTSSTTTSARKPSGASQAVQNRQIMAKIGIQPRLKYPPQEPGLIAAGNDNNNNTECFVQQTGTTRGDRKYSLAQGSERKMDDTSGGKVRGGAGSETGEKKPGKKVAKADAEMKEYMPPDGSDEENFKDDPPKPPPKKFSGSEGGEEDDGEGEEEETSSAFHGEDEIDYDSIQAGPPEPKCISLKPKNGKGVPRPPQPDDFCKCNEKEFRRERRRLVKYAKMSNMPGWKAPVFGESYYPYGEGPRYLSDEDSSYNEDNGADPCATFEQKLLRLKKDRCCDPLLPVPKPCLLCNEACRKLLRIRKQRRKLFCNEVEPPKSPKYFEDIPVDFPKDYVRFNALKVMQTPAATPKAKIVLTRNGDKVDFCKSGLARLFVTRPGFGTVPNYIKCRKRELEFCAKFKTSTKNKSKGANARTNVFGYTKPLAIKRKAIKRSRSTSNSRSMSAKSKSLNKAHKGPSYF